MQKMPKKKERVDHFSYSHLPVCSSSPFFERYLQPIKYKLALAKFHVISPEKL